MPYVFRTKFEGNKLNLKAGETVYAQCDVNDGSFNSDHSYLACTMSSAVDKSGGSATGEIKFDFVFNAGGSSNDVDISAAKHFSSGKNEIDFSDMTADVDFQAGPFFTDKKNNELLYYSRSTPQNLEQVYVLSGDCSDGINSGSMIYTTNNSLDCSQFKLKMTKDLNDFYMPKSANSVDDSSISCSDDNKKLTATFKNIPSGYRVFLEGFEKYPAGSSYVKHLYAENLKCSGGSTKVDGITKIINVIDGFASSNGNKHESSVLPTSICTSCPETSSSSELSTTAHCDKCEHSSTAKSSQTTTTTMETRTATSVVPCAECSSKSKSTSDVESHSTSNVESKSTSDVESISTSETESQSTSNVESKSTSKTESSTGEEVSCTSCTSSGSETQSTSQYVPCTECTQPTSTVESTTRNTYTSHSSVLPTSIYSSFSSQPPVSSPTTTESDVSTPCAACTHTSVLRSSVHSTEISETEPSLSQTTPCDDCSQATVGSTETTSQTHVTTTVPSDSSVLDTSVTSTSTSPPRFSTYEISVQTDSYESLVPIVPIDTSMVSEPVDETTVVGSTTTLVDNSGTPTAGFLRSSAAESSVTASQDQGFSSENVSHAPVASAPSTHAPFTSSGVQSSSQLVPTSANFPYEASSNANHYSLVVLLLSMFVFFL